MTAIISEVLASIGYITFNRPDKRNALTTEMLVRLADLWSDWAQRADVRVVIVTGAGSEAFCAGGDLNNSIPLITGARNAGSEWDEKLLNTPHVRDVAMLRSFFPKPVIAAVNGVCVAGGMEFLQGTDIRVASASATFGLPEVRHGLIPACGSLVRLTRQIPHCTAMELMLIGGTIDAAEALRIGLLNYVVSAENLMSKAQMLAHAIVRNAPLAVEKIKDIAIGTSGLRLEEAFAIEDEAFRGIAATQDAKEGPLAFVEKRHPRFRGC